MEYTHDPVLLCECIEALNIKSGGVYIDATLGRGGHSQRILEKLSEDGHLYCFDRDEEAIDAVKEKFSTDKVTLIHSDFRYIDTEFLQNGGTKADGILFDLGVSSPQLDDASRGFSYTESAPLDMRMDKGQKLTAYDIVNGYAKEDIKRILFEYGEERYAPVIAAAIERERAKEPIDTTDRLADIIKSAMPAAARREKQHPAKRSFQAIRIAVNDELSAIREAIKNAVAILGSGGRIAVISFHSLEDRIVKTAFSELSKGCICPPEFPVCVCGKKAEIKVLTRRPITPTDEEIKRNPRSRSAKLRVAEKVL